MAVKKFEYSIICDAEGCDNLATKEICVCGDLPFARVCDDCAKKIYDGLKEFYGDGGKKNGGKK